MSDGKQCNFSKSNGERCKAWAMADCEFCFTHNPETRADKLEAVIKGGKAPKKNYRPLPVIRINNTNDVVGLLATTINEVRGGIIDIRVANCIGYLAGHLVRAMELSSLENRMEEIEKIVMEKLNNQKL